MAVLSAPKSNATPVYESHAAHFNGEYPPFIYDTPNDVPEIISPHNFDCHWHEGVEILGFVEGNARVICDSQIHHVAEGDFLIVNANQLHMIESDAPGCRYHCLILERDYCRTHGVDIEKLSFEVQFRDPSMMVGLNRIWAETEQNRPYAKLRIEAEVLMLFAKLCDRHLPNGCTVSVQNDRPVDLVKQTITFLNHHYREPLSLDEICAAVGFSKYYLCRTFRSVTGQTIVDYINLQRCRSAQSMLMRGECNVSECAEACGFSSISYFTRQYRRIIGETPSATRHAARRLSID